MESRAQVIKSNKDKKVSISVIPGHFATSHSHVNYYIDMTSVKCNQVVAAEAAKVLAQKYVTSKQVDTIVCMDNCEMIGGFMAMELAANGVGAINKNTGISVVNPEYNINGQMVFRDNIQSLIWNKNIVLLVASATTGKTINRCIECIQYYGGNIVGISAIFSASRKSRDGYEIDSIFEDSDLPEYSTYDFKSCPNCKAQRKIDAIVNSNGYTKL
ncbi:MAG: orotate phosphoribosyltransferase [Lachnospiraceae bacterium]|nr:orotate phosphoribosyltransferase [Lachnospiraceae bacterium]